MFLFCLLQTTEQWPGQSAGGERSKDKEEWRVESTVDYKEEVQHEIRKIYYIIIISVVNSEDHEFRVFSDSALKGFYHNYLKYKRDF